METTKQPRKDHSRHRRTVLQRRNPAGRNRRLITFPEHNYCKYLFFISSLPAKVKTLSRYLRDHWKIENSQHYVLDVTFSEDASRIRKGSAPEVSGGFRRMALNILRQDTTLKESIRGKRLMAGWDGTILDKIYAGFNAV